MALVLWHGMKCDRKAQEDSRTMVKRSAAAAAAVLFVVV